MAAPELTIPASLCALDDTQYASAAGVPGSSFLGTVTAQNDRDLHAILRRARGWSAIVGGVAPLGAAICCDFPGKRIGPWPLRTCLGGRQASWWISALIPMGLTCYAQAFTMGPPIPYARSTSANTLTLLGTGAIADYGPLTVPVLPDQMNQCGLILQSPLQGAYLTGAVISFGQTWIQGAAGAFAALGAPPQAAIELTDGLLGGATSLSALHQIVKVRAIAAANDTVDIWPAFAEDEIQALSPGVAAYGWRYALTIPIELHAVYLRERALTGTLLGEV